MIANIEAVVFDLDGTLLDRRRSFECFVRGQWDRFSHALHSVGTDEYVQTLVQLDQNGYAPRAGLFAGVVAQFGLPSDLSEILLTDYRAGFPNSCMLFPDVNCTLAALRASGLKLGLITNGSVRMQSRKVECLGLAAVFDIIVVSGAEGISKPDSKIFRLALERLHTDPARSVYVGDHPEIDVAGARAAGMQTIWRRDHAGSEVVDADAVIDAIGDLIAVLGVDPVGFSG